MSLLSGIDDLFGSVLNSNTAQSAIDIYTQKTAAENAANIAKAQAAADLAKAKAAEAAAKAASTSSAGNIGGIPTNYLLYGGAAVLGLGLVIFIATRKR